MMKGAYVMKKLRKIISALVCVAILASAFPAFSADDGAVYISEEFESYGENDTALPAFITHYSGIDTRVVSDNGSKVLHSRSYVDPVELGINIPAITDSQTVVSAKIKITGDKASGRLFRYKKGTATLDMLTLSERGSMTLYDNYEVGGLPEDKYTQITFVFDWDRQNVDFYINQKAILTDWLLPASARYVSPESFGFALDYKEAENGFYMDDIRVYGGSVLPWNRKFPTEKPSEDVFDYTPTEEVTVPVELVKMFDFEASTSGANISNLGGKIAHGKDDERGFISFYADANTVGGSFADISYNALANYRKYVIELNVKVNELSGSAKLGILDKKNAAGSFGSVGYNINSSGELVTNAVSGPIATIPFGEWTRISCVYNIPAGKCSVYVNGEFKVTHDVSSIFYPVLCRLDLINPMGSVHDTQIDYFKIYTGDAPVAEDYFDENKDSNIADSEYVSILDPKDKLSEALNGKIMFMLNNETMYYNGEKTSYASEMYKPANINGTIMIPSAMFSKISGLTVLRDKSSGLVKIGDRAVMTVGSADYVLDGKPKTLISAVAEQDGAVYLPLRSVAEQIMQKYVIWDSRGNVVISDTPIEPNKKYTYVDRNYQWTDANLLYRYMQFDNPSGKKMIDDLTSNFPDKKHPRVYWTNDDIDYVLNKVETNNRWKSAYTSEINTAAGVLKQDFSSYATVADSGKQSAGILIQRVMKPLATAYIMTGDERYAKKGVEIMKIFAAWETNGASTSNLAVGHWCSGMGIGFDAFYNYMKSTPEGREDIKYFKERIKTLIFDDLIKTFTGKGGNLGYVTLQDNFLGVGSGGIMTLALAVADEEDMRSDAEFILENVLKTFYTAAEIYFPDGGYYESVSYSEYMMSNLVMGLDALFMCCGTDYGLGDAPGFTKAGDFFTYAQSPDMSFGFHDTTMVYNVCVTREFMGYRYGELLSAEMGRIQKALGNRSMNIKALYYYDKAITDKGITVDTSSVPADRWFSHAGTGTLTSSRFTSDPVFVGFHGGLTGVPHDMLDLGEFIFETDNIIWATDLCSDNYSLPGYFSTTYGYRIYRKRTEAENCLVINPKVDSETYHGQKIGAVAEMIDCEFNKPKGAWSVLDLTDAYERDVKKYHRGYYLGDDRNTLTVQDEVSLKKTSELYWFMNTKQKIDIIDNNTAKLTAPNGKTLTVDVYTNIPSYELKVMDCKPLPSSPFVEGQADNSAFRKLTIYAPEASGEVVISVKLSPDDRDYLYTPLTYKSISEWTVPDGEVAVSPRLTGIYADGKPLDTFVPGSREFRIQLPVGTSVPPEITVTSDVGTTSVVQAQSLADEAVITFENEGFKTAVYTVGFDVSLDREIFVTDAIIESPNQFVGTNGTLITPVIADMGTVPQQENGPSNMVDSDFGTRAAQEGHGLWFEIDLGRVEELRGVALSFYEGNKRKAIFDILYSEDGTNFKRVFSGSALGRTTEFESIELPGKARYIRFIANGYRVDGSDAIGQWNSITEFRAYK